MCNVDVSTLSHILLDKAHGKQQMTFKTSCLAQGAPGSALQGLCHCFSRIFHLSLRLWSPCSLSNMFIRIRRGRPEAFLGSIEALAKCFGPCRIEAPEKNTKGTQRSLCRILELNKRASRLFEEGLHVPWLCSSQLAFKARKRAPTTQRA